MSKKDSQPTIELPVSAGPNTPYSQSLQSMLQLLILWRHAEQIKFYSNKSQ